ncbi:type II toxin-antitoxin system PemK/MazF family toxin [Bacillus thuringiensis]|uniref:type II toxin-antitoxin system PemK/MazF family toxin n=1 Tax=Bacillus thuringiensis TaxID=1428 RepID=UPI003988973E
MGNNGRDARYSLVEWTGSQEGAERLAAQILMSEQFNDVDPMHPLGGPDGKKDLKCSKDGTVYIVGCYFPRGQQKFPAIKSKFIGDLEGVKSNNVDGFIFVTNQEITVSERKELEEVAEHPIKLFHLERVINILMRPEHIGTRREYLGLDISMEEMLSFFGKYENTMSTIVNMSKLIERMSTAYEQGEKQVQTEQQVQTIQSPVPSLNASSNKIKPRMHKVPTMIRRGEVYFADLGSPMDSEIGGVRPVVIVSNYINNKHAPFVTIVPITGKIDRARIPTQVNLGTSIHPSTRSIAMAEQIRTIGKQRVIKKITTLDEEVMRKLNDAISIQMELTTF